MTNTNYYQNQTVTNSLIPLTYTITNTKSLPKPFQNSKTLTYTVTNTLETFTHTGADNLETITNTITENLETLTQTLTNNRFYRVSRILNEPCTCGLPPGQ